MTAAEAENAGGCRGTVGEKGGRSIRKRKNRRAEHDGLDMRSCEASRFVPTSYGSGKDTAACSVKLWNDERGGDSEILYSSPPADTICVIARLRLLASRDRAATASPTRSIFRGRKLPSGNFLPQNQKGPNAEASATRLSSSTGASKAKRNRIPNRL